MATALVRRIIQEKGPLTGKELYQLVKSTPISSAPASEVDTDPALWQRTQAARRKGGLSADEPLVPSFSFLKKRVFPELEKDPIIQLKHIKRPAHSSPSSPSTSTSTSSKTPPSKGDVSTWVWRTVPSEELELVQQRARSAAAKKQGPRDPLKYFEDTDTLKLGGKEDILHLNWRRRQARPAKEGAERELVRAHRARTEAAQAA